MTAALAALVDRWWGEPPAAVHPVVLMGRWLTPSGRWARARRGPAAQTGAGAAAWVVGLVAAVTAARALDRASRALPHPLELGVRAVLLSTLWSWRLLDREVAAVERAFSTADGPAAARTAVSRLVSRDVDALDAAGVRGAALSSLAENLSDSVVAPALWYATGGLPAAAAYRYVNTADAMWGYRGAWEWAGKVAARADDVANLAPARLTAALLAGLPAPGAPPPAAPRGIRTDARRTPSPNAGWPMGALARRLDVRLEKHGVYVLHPAGRAPGPADVRLARSLAGRAATLAFAVTAVVTLPRDRAVAVARGRTC